MTEEELKQAYFELIKEDLNNFKDIELLQAAPAPVRLAIDKLISNSNKDSTVQSEGIADLKVTYFDVKGFPNDVLVLLNPYRRLRW